MSEHQNSEVITKEKIDKAINLLKEQKSKVNLLIWTIFIVFIWILIVDVKFQPFGLKLKTSTGLVDKYSDKSLVVIEKNQKGEVIKETTTQKLEPGKTFWDWMSLLLAPATLAGLGFWFQNLQQEAKDLKESADKDAVLRKESADKKAVEVQHHEEALQNYLNSLSELLVDKQLKKLLKKNKGTQQAKSENQAANVTPNPSIDTEAALEVVKARTLSLLRLFKDDIPRKASVLSFLGDTDLLIELELDLSRTDWKNANFRRANLKNVKLNNAHLEGADLRYAQLEEADLMGADLEGADLEGADLEGADLEGAKNLTPEQVQKAKNWNEAKYDEKFRAKLGLPPDPPPTPLHPSVRG